MIKNVKAVVVIMNLWQRYTAMFEIRDAEGKVYRPFSAPLAMGYGVHIVPFASCVLRTSVDVFEGLSHNKNTCVTSYTDIYSILIGFHG